MTTNTYARVTSVTYWLALAIWFGSLMTVAIAAMIAFTVLPEQDLTLSAYSDYRPEQHGRIAAGLVLDPIFAITDVVQIVAAIVAVGMVFLQLVAFRMRVSRPANWLRTLAILAAGGVLCYRLVVVTPPMNDALTEYRAAAMAGDVELADRLRASFQDDHTRAERLFQVTFLLVIAAMVLSASAVVPLTHKPAERSHKPGNTKRDEPQ